MAFALGSINFADYDCVHVGLCWSDLWQVCSVFGSFPTKIILTPINVSIKLRTYLSVVQCIFVCSILLSISLPQNFFWLTDAGA